MFHSLCRQLYLIICSGLLLVVSGCSVSPVQPDSLLTEYPRLFPDYTGVTFPVNIAAPSFVIEEEGEKYYVEIGSNENAFIRLKNKSGKIKIPLKKWQELLKDAAGESIYIRISILQEDKWTQYADVINYISKTEIDPYLVYRLLYPGYELWNEMGIYQRNLTNYKEEILLDNKNYEKGCMNCHTFNKNSSETMMVHIRGNVGGTIIYKDGDIRKIDIKAPGLELPATYPAWHPDGRYIAYSTNNVSQFFHSTGTKTVEVADSASDLVILDTETNTLFTDSLIYGEEWMETFPIWSPDGKQLYFCRARKKEKDTRLDEIRYDLYRISFDEPTKTFGTPELVYNASGENKSISFPRFSPDGKYLMIVLSDYGNFSIWHPESDLALLSLENDELQLLNEVNSDDVDSFHSWSSTGDWFVFSSKRIDGLWAHPYISFFDKETGRATKPFILPQENPDFYTSFLLSFNLPELVKDPITITKEMIDASRNEGEKVLWAE